eukprot:NODE_1112_length_1461_cov_146.702399_g1101_i0.p1 GENE.NODE_1112_length_1461_cov_146.702399_g1101_i0~~NODE_1112_length_1461_cov_146.702399_g1101_i0.p1  ORF type:complete len:437 (+),score=83.01 NODE_1112_length_1461_cov_146.702399_g1101_i0:71-1381(+)
MQRDKFAVCIGQNNYECCTPLEKAVPDCSAMASKLNSLGFRVFQSKDSSKKDMKRVIRDFHQSLTPNCLAVFYFSGYSMQQDGLNFCVPVDAEVGLSADIDDECVSLNWVLKGMTECEACLSVVLMEAARGNPFEATWKSQTVPSYKGLAAMKPPPGSLIAFSSEPGSTVSFEYTDEDHGVFTSSLLMALPVPDRSVTEVMREVRAAVAAATDGQQRVWVQSRLMDDFYFCRTGSPTAASGALAASSGDSPNAAGSPSKKSPDRLRSRSPQRAYSPQSRREHAWNFCAVAHPEGAFADATVDSSGLYSKCYHPSATEDSNCIVGLEPPLHQGVHSVRLKFTRGPIETDAAHSVELIQANSEYTNETPSLTFELPNVMNCEARFDIDFPNDVMTMTTNDDQPPVSLPISDLGNVGAVKPFRLVIYLWDAESIVEVLP